MRFNLIKLRKVRNFGEVINATVAFFRENFINILKTCTPIALPVALIGGLIAGFSASKFYGALVSPRRYTFGENSSGPDYDYLTLVYVGYVILALSTFFFYVPVYQYIVLYLTHKKEQITFRMIWSNCWRKF